VSGLGVLWKQYHHTVRHSPIREIVAVGTPMPIAIFSSFVRPVGVLIEVADAVLDDMLSVGEVAS
jgi:hypothetical protein